MIVSLYKNEYLRLPTSDDIKAITKLHKFDEKNCRWRENDLRFGNRVEKPFFLHRFCVERVLAFLFQVFSPGSKVVVFIPKQTIFGIGLNAPARFLR
jgi:hypothetical protein